MLCVLALHSHGNRPGLGMSEGSVSLGSALCLVFGAFLKRIVSVLETDVAVQWTVQCQRTFKKKSCCHLELLFFSMSREFKFQFE